MKRFTKIAFTLFQVLFYIFSGLTIIAFVFWVFGSERQFRVMNLLLMAILFLISYIILYRVHMLFNDEVDDDPEDL